MQLILVINYGRKKRRYDRHYTYETLLNILNLKIIGIQIIVKSIL